MLSPLKRVLFPHDLSSSLLDSSIMSSASTSASISASTTSRRSKKKEKTNIGNKKEKSTTTMTTTTTTKKKKTQQANNKKMSARSSSTTLTGGGLTALVATTKPSSTRQQHVHVQQGNNNINNRKRSRSNSKSKGATNLSTNQSTGSETSGLTALFLQNTDSQNATALSSSTSTKSPPIKKRRSKRQRDNRNMARVEASKKHQANSQGLSALLTTSAGGGGGRRRRLGDTTNIIYMSSTKKVPSKPADLAVLDLLNSSLESNENHQPKPSEKKQKQSHNKQTQQRLSNNNVPSVLELSSQASSTMMMTTTTTTRKNRSDRQRTKQTRRPLKNVTDSLGTLGGTIIPAVNKTKQKNIRTTLDVTDSLGSMGVNGNTRNHKKNGSFTTTGRRNQQTGKRQKRQQSRKSSSSVGDANTSDDVALNKSVGISQKDATDEEKSQSGNANHDSSTSLSTISGNGASDAKFDQNGHTTEEDAGIIHEKNSTEEDEKDRRIRELEAELEAARRFMMEQTKKEEKNDRSVSISTTGLYVDKSSASSTSHSTLTAVHNSNDNKQNNPSPKRPVLERRRSKRLSNSRKMDPPGMCQTKESDVDDSIDSRCDDEIDMLHSGVQSEESKVETELAAREQMLSVPNQDHHVTEQMPFPSTLESPSPIKESNVDSSLVSATGESTPERRQKPKMVLRKSVGSTASPQNAEEFLDFVEDQNDGYDTYESTLQSSTLNQTEKPASSNLLEDEQKANEAGQKIQKEEIHEINNQQEDDSPKILSPEIHSSSDQDVPTEKIGTYCESKEKASIPDVQNIKESRPRRKRVQPKRLVDEAEEICREMENIEAKKKPNKGKTRGRPKKEPQEKSTTDTDIPQNASPDAGDSPNDTNSDTSRSRRRTRSTGSQSLDVDTFVSDVVASIDVERLVGALNSELSSKSTRKNNKDEGFEDDIFDATPMRCEAKPKTKSANAESKNDRCGGDEDDIFDATPLRHEEKSEIKSDTKTDSVCDGGADEDDIFNSTPLQENLNSKLGQEEDSKESSRKGRRQRTRPDRFGEYADGVSDSPNDMAISTTAKKQNKGPVVSKKNKKRVRISSEGLKKDGERKPNSPPVDMFGGDWSSDDLEKLRMAHKRVNPQSSCFWDDVSDRLDGKWTATECRDKWFSLVKTPIIGRKTKRHKVDEATEGHEDHQHHIESIAVADDDIFNATPMKNVVANLEDDKNLKGISNMELKGSAIKVKDRSAVAKSNDGDKTSYTDDIEENEGRKHVVSRGPPQGYKTYLQSMRRTMKRELKAKKKKKASKFSSLKLGKNLSEWADEGDVEMNCRLSPGGTLQIQKSGHDSDHDDMWGEDEEEM